MPHKQIRYQFLLSEWLETTILKEVFPYLETRGFDMEHDPDQPEYLLFDNYSLHDYFRLYPRGTGPELVSIFIAMEGVLPDYNLFDYCLAYWDANFSHLFAERYFPFIHFDKRQASFLDHIMRPQPVPHIKEKFCNFLYSHPGVPERKSLFDALSAYKRVDALGLYLNNTLQGINHNPESWCEDSIELKRPYKFSIACENTMVQGYATEKIWTSFVARTVPIYWGDPHIERCYNPQSFVNCHRYANFREVMARVQEIDQDDRLWLEMVNTHPIQPEYE
ncbi:MAG: glycosyltransferase family 10 [Spirochaetota bacterium]